MVKNLLWWNLFCLVVGFQLPTDVTEEKKVNKNKTEMIMKTNLLICRATHKTFSNSKFQKLTSGLILIKLSTKTIKKKL